jgi:DNA-binding LytR/AlgR family response regulator
MRKLTAVVADDEEFMAEMLRRLLEQYTNIKVAGLAYDGDEALKLVEQYQPDVVFLDIQMPGKTGIEVAAVLNKNPYSPTVVFVTAYDEFAMKAFEVSALDYILKPFDEADIKRVMDKVRKVYLKYSTVEEKRLSTAAIYPQKFCIAVDEEMLIIDVCNIRFVYAEDRAVFIQTIDGNKYPAKHTLQEFEHKLDSMQFFRCHRNYIVNMNEVKQITPWFNRGYLLKLKGSKKAEIPVSRAKVKDLERYMDFK